MSSRTDIPQDPILKARRIWEFHPWLQGPLRMTSEWVWKSLFRGLKSWGQCLVQRQQWNEAEVGLFLVAAPWLFLLLLRLGVLLLYWFLLDPFLWITCTWILWSRSMVGRSDTRHWLDLFWWRTYSDVGKEQGREVGRRAYKREGEREG